MCLKLLFLRRNSEALAYLALPEGKDDILPQRYKNFFLTLSCATFFSTKLMKHTFLKVQLHKIFSTFFPLICKLKIISVHVRSSWNPSAEQITAHSICTCVHHPISWHGSISRNSNHFYKLNLAHAFQA